MSMVRLLAEGAGEAVRLVPLLFTLGGAPAHAQLPRPVPAQEAAAGATAAIWPASGSTAPRLVSEHLELTLADSGSVVRTTLVYRNDTDSPVTVHYALPLAGAVSLRGLDDEPLESPGLLAPRDCSCPARSDDEVRDEPAETAQFAEAGEADPLATQSGLMWLAPGDEVTLVAVRPVAVQARDTRRRVVLALPEAEDGQPVPRFSAEVEVAANAPIVALGSATHGGEVDGLGNSRARLIVPNGRADAGRFFSVDLELGHADRADPPRWGREDRLPVAAR